MRIRFLCLCVLVISRNGAAGAPPLPQDVRAVFQKRCIECHSGKERKANLDLTTPEGIARGGRRGAIVAPRKPDDSRMWQMIQKERMPPEEPLPEPERRVLRRWIEAGAPGLDPMLVAGHWAFRPPIRPAVPTVGRGEAARTPVDRFILAALEKKGLALGPEADRARLLRRVSFDLTGLPPTPAEMQAFLADSSPDAYERMVERYLAAPRYGERWGKFWLDAAGYADSNGYFSADSDRPLAWRYRDHVIRSFNADKPYDRFVREQLAGDELAGHVAGGDVTPDMVEPLAATHFLRNAPDGSGESDGNPDEVRIDRYTVLEGNLQITMNCLLGVTVQCARCHDHKFEPLTQEEYYSLQAILFPAYCPDHWVKPNDRTVMVTTRARREEYQRRIGQIERQIKALRDSLASVAAPLREQLVEELSAKKPAPPPKISDDDLAKRFPEYGALRDQVRKAIVAREKDRPTPPEKLAVLVDAVPDVPAHHILVRGQHNKPGREVKPGVPAALSTSSNTYRLDARPGGGTTTGRRSALARWVTSPKNPLFARVMVNRIWQHHFGTGLVATPDNLGQSGARPSHPELLDWLAVEFVEHGYSIKHLHRLILCSAVYRQSSAPRKDGLAADPDDLLLWRYPLRRLDAESVRDAMLAVSGELDLRMGGPYVPTRRTPEGVVEVDEKDERARRRSIYLQQRRTQVATFLELFDAPAVAVTCSVRNTSTVPLQALALLNADFARRRAEAFARRLGAASGDDGRILLAFRLACGREPNERERAASRRFIEAQREVYGREKDGEPRVWADFCQMMLASNAFLYVE
jgi:hypothetical protein